MTRTRPRRRILVRLVVAAAALAAASFAGSAPLRETFDTSAGPVTVERVVGDLDHPWALDFLPDGALLVTERGGRLLLIADDERREIAGTPAVFAQGQGGLLDVALARDFAETGTLFLTYAEPAGAGLARTAVARARLDREAGALTDLEVILRQTPAVRGGRHFGSRVVEATDGTLFVTFGERGQGEPAQDLRTTLGKVVRIAPDGSIPPDNPFASGGGLPEIWSYGHRNPQGAALDAAGRLWIVEHGAKGGDELNRPLPGRNYGWPEVSFGEHYSGAPFPASRRPDVTPPVFYWDPSIAPSGLAVYGGDMFPEWRGDMLVGALKYQLIARVDMDNGEAVGEERLFRGAFGRIRDVAVSPDGAIWFVTDESDGGVYRISRVE